MAGDGRARGRGGSMIRGSDVGSLARSARRRLAGIRLRIVVAYMLLLACDCRGPDHAPGASQPAPPRHSTGEVRPRGGGAPSAGGRGHRPIDRRSARPGRGTDLRHHSSATSRATTRRSTRSSGGSRTDAASTPPACCSMMARCSKRWWSARPATATFGTAVGEVRSLAVPLTVDTGSSSGACRRSSSSPSSPTPRDELAEGDRRCHHRDRRARRFGIGGMVARGSCAQPGPRAHSNGPPDQRLRPVSENSGRRPRRAGRAGVRRSTTWSTGWRRASARSAALPRRRRPRAADADHDRTWSSRVPR